MCRWLAAMAVVLLFAGCSRTDAPVRNSSQVTPTNAPAVRPLDKSLAEKRAERQTRLTTKGQAPQEWELQEPPAGVSEVSYDSGSLSLKAWLAIPEGTKGKHPALVFAHGGFAFDKSDYEGVQDWVTAGWVVIVPFLRGENGQAGYYDLYFHEVDDLIAAGHYVATSEYVNAEQVFCMGHSAGGTRCMLAAMLASPFKGAGSIGGWISFDRGILNQEELAPFDLNDSWEIETRDPSRNVASLLIPLTIAHGTGESLWRTSAIRFSQAAKARGLAVEYLVTVGDHWTCFEEASKLIRQSFEKQIGR